MQGIIDLPAHFENKFMKVEYLSNNNVVITSYKGFAEDEIIKKGLLKAIDILKKSNAINMVFDNTRFEGATPELQEWVKNKYFNLAYDSGVRNFAIVVPDHIYAVFSIEFATNNDMREVMNIEKFKDPQEAIKWVALK